MGVAQNFITGTLMRSLRAISAIQEVAFFMPIIQFSKNAKLTSRSSETLASNVTGFAQTWEFPMKHRTVTTLLLTVLLATVGLAQGAPQLVIDLSEEKVNQSTDERSGTNDIAYFPGDTIRYKLQARNAGSGIMTKPVVTDPIPQGVSYLAATAKGEDSIIEYSIDGGVSYHNWPVTYIVRNAAGQNIEVNATADMISHIRWLIQTELPAQNYKNLEFMVEVN